MKLLRRLLQKSKYQKYYRAIWHIIRRQGRFLRRHWVGVIGSVGFIFLGISFLITNFFPAYRSLSDAQPLKASQHKNHQGLYQQYQIADKNVLGFELIRINVSGDAVIAGHAPAQTQVIIELNGKAIGSAKTDNHREWVFLTPDPLPTGQHRLTLEAIDNQNHTKIYGDQSLLIIVPKKSVVLKTDAKNDEPLVVLLPNDAESGSRVLRNQFAADKTPVGQYFTVETVDYNHSEQGLLIIGGQIQSEAVEMLIYIDNRPIARKRVAGKGAIPLNWEVQVPGKIDAGHYQLQVDMVAGNKVILRRVLPFQF